MLIRKNLFLLNLSSFPNDILKIIYEFIPSHNLIFLTSLNYKKSHSELKLTYNLNNKMWERYIKFILRKDYHYVMKQILNENWRIWNVSFYHNKKIIYKNNIFNKYIDFIRELANEYESIKCKTLINDCYKENNISINKNKNISRKF